MAAAPDDDARRTLAELEAKLRELERELLRGYDGEPSVAPEHPAPAPPEPAAPPEPPASPEFAAPPEPLAFPPAAAPADADLSAHAADTAEPGTEGEQLAAAPPEFAAPPEPLAPPDFAAPPEPAAPSEPAAPPEPSPLGASPEPAAPPEGAPLSPEWPAPDTRLHAAPQPEPEPEPEPEPVARLDHDALDAAHDLLGSLRDTIEDMGLTSARVTAEAKAVADDHGRTLGRMARAAEAASRAEQAANEAGRLAASVVVEAGPFADAGAVTALRDTLASQPGARDAYIRGVEDGRAVIEVHLDPPSS